MTQAVHLDAMRAWSTPARAALPKPTDRLPLGNSGLMVSPLCLGITEDPATVAAAFEAGVNFFFVSADLHWPLYDGVRHGLRDLFASRPSARDDIVVAVVSYLDQPLFQALQFNEVIDAVPGLQRVDVLVAGAVPDAQNFGARLQVVRDARAAGRCGARAIGASFHHRASALLSVSYESLDINYVRYNTAHPGARHEIFPYVRQQRKNLIFNFKSLMSMVSPERFAQLGLPGSYWLPKPTDYYRFALTQPALDGVLCSPTTPAQLEQLVKALDEPPLTALEEQYMTWLSSLAMPRWF